MNKMDINLASPITKAASQQTYYTIRYLVDQARVNDAYQAYAYFRWADDILDSDSVSSSERLSFLVRQESLLESGYAGEATREITVQEKMLVDLVHSDVEKNSGLQTYVRNMMKVLDFDARRRGRLISQIELNEYTRWLATSVTEALHYFIGHDAYAPQDETRYLAVSAAHIAHMLRDTFDDMQAGYYNIPLEVLEANHIGIQDVHSQAYRAWVKNRVQLARQYFEAGKAYFGRIQSRRARLAGCAYSARFEWLLDTIEREDYYLRPQYRERKSLAPGLRMGWLALSSLVQLRGEAPLQQPGVPQPVVKLWKQK